MGENDNCLMCFEKMEKELCILANCEHIFHKECVQSYLKAEIDQSKCPLLCPLLNCKIEIAPRDMNRALKQEEMEKFQKYSFLQAVGV